MNGIVFRCPVCGQALEKRTDEKRYLCPSGHSFDISRQGHVNLLLPQKRGSSLPGDSPDMVRSRESFLGKGYYEGFSDGVNALCAEALGDARTAALGDAGCGEGYYTCRLVKSLQNASVSVCAAGFDLSRDAAARGAVKSRAVGGISFAVASLFEMPLFDSSLDGLINLFAPAAPDEFFRVLKPDGFIIMAVPGPDHLFGLKSAIYDRPYTNEIRRDVLPGFALKKVLSVNYGITLKSHEDIMNLFAMTPYYWKTSREDVSKLNSLSELGTPVSFDILLYRKE